MDAYLIGPRVSPPRHKYIIIYVLYTAFETAYSLASFWPQKREQKVEIRVETRARVVYCPSRNFRVDAYTVYMLVCVYLFYNI